MSCCGRLRTPTSIPLQNATGREEARRPVYFEYGGATALTAVGPVTGNYYRLERSWARVAVDGRDAAALAAIPALRQVTG